MKTYRCISQVFHAGGLYRVGDEIETNADMSATYWQQLGGETLQDSMQLYDAISDTYSLAKIPKEIFFNVVGSTTDTVAADGTSFFLVPDSMNGMNLTKATLSVHDPNGATGGAGTALVRRVRLGSRMGDDTTQIDVSDEAGDTVRYTYDTTGTDPLISTSTLSVGDEVDLSGFTTAAANGHFTLTGVGANYFEVTNASLGTFDTDETSVTITPTRHRDMLSTGVTVSYNEYYASDGVIDTSNDDVTEGDRLFIDVTAVTTGAVQKGMSMTLYFK
jgi:hypothetical protein